MTSLFSRHFRRIFIAGALLLPSCHLSAQDEKQEEQKYVKLITDLGGKVLYNNYHHIISILLPHTRVDDSALKEISKIRSLQMIDLSANPEHSNDLPVDLLVWMTRQYSLQAIKFNGQIVTDTGTEHLSTLPNLKVLDLGGVSVTDATLEHLKHPNLQELVVGEVPLRNIDDHVQSVFKITDKGLSRLVRFLYLQKLSLRATAISDVSLIEIAKIKNLQHLDLGNTGITKNGLKYLKDMRLQTLRIDHTPTSGDGIKILAALRSLQDLSLASTTVTDVDLRALRSLSSLTALDLSNTGITHLGLKELATFPSLKTLKINHTKIDPEGLVVLGGIKLLENLSLCNTGIGGGIDALKPLKSLRTLEAASLNISDDDLKTISGFKSLKKLDISNSSVTDSGMKWIQSLASLEHLDLSQTSISDDGLSKLAKLSNLRTLDLAGTRVTDAGMQHLAAMANLQKINISHTSVSRSTPARQNLLVVQE